MDIIKISTFLVILNVVALVLMPTTNESLTQSSLILPKNLPVGEKPIEMNCDNNSFHLVSSKTNFWCVVKMSSEQSVQVEDFYLRYWYNQSAFQSRKTGSLCMLGNPYQQGSGFGDKDFTAVSLLDDFYIQAGMGPINWSFEHLRSGWEGFQVRGTTEGAFSYLANPAYFVYAVSSDKAGMELWINTTGNVTFTLAEGDEVFLFSRENFVGKINTGCRWGTFMVDGKIQVDIENTFIGWVELLGCTGWEKFGYTDPQGRQKEMMQVDWRGSTIYRNGSLFDPWRELIVGENGIWTFEMDMINGGFLGSEVLLFGADVLLS